MERKENICDEHKQELNQITAENSIPTSEKMLQHSIKALEIKVYSTRGKLGLLIPNLSALSNDFAVIRKTLDDVDHGFALNATNENSRLYSTRGKLGLLIQNLSALSNDFAIIRKTLDDVGHGFARNATTENSRLASQ